jgi:DNA gyrase inhibitor GyrI
MSSFSKETRPIAKKEYNCDASAWLDNDGKCTDDMTPEQIKIYDSARAERFKIKAGSQYIKQTGMIGGEWAVYRARIDMHELAIKLGVMDN